MTKKEIDYLPDYEKNKLAEQIRTFYYDVPEEEYRPYSKDMDYSDSIKSIRLLLESPEKTETLLNNMSLILDSTDNTNRLYERLFRILLIIKTAITVCFLQRKQKRLIMFQFLKRLKALHKEIIVFLKKQLLRFCLVSADI